MSDQPRTAAAIAKRIRNGDERAAERLRSHGWSVTPPEHANTDWRAIADVLAQRMHNHAYCNQHPAAKPEPGCPFCEDRLAYGQFQLAESRERRG